MDIYTIGCTRTTAERFFTRLADAGIERVLDVRLNSTSQLAGFAKAGDLPYLLGELLGARYEQEPLLAPTKELLAQARSANADWPRFEERFLALMDERKAHEALSPSDFRAPTALLCSEATPERCHRRLVCDHLAAHWPGVSVSHL
jgi:uncharacterized protein (DUF488 family)